VPEIARANPRCKNELMTQTAAPNRKPRAPHRVPLWDNARWLAIALVVVGHGILPLIAESDAAYSVYLFIYSFHVPVFVAVRRRRRAPGRSGGCSPTSWCHTSSSRPSGR
jgi:hypothetical protein